MKQATLVAGTGGEDPEGIFHCAGDERGTGSLRQVRQNGKEDRGNGAEAQAFSELSGEAAADDPFRDMEKDMQLEAEMRSSWKK